jgi:hypothetical protein
MIVFSAREQKRLYKILKLFVGKSAWVCKGTRRNETLGGQGI